MPGKNFIFSTKTENKISNLFSKPIDDRHLKRTISYLSHARKRKCRKNNQRLKSKRFCWDHQSIYHNHSIILKSRHAAYIEEELRKAMLLHDWESCARLLSLVIKTGMRNQTVFIFKVCSLLIFHHPGMIPDILGKFLNSVTNYKNESDVEEFILLILTLRKKLLCPGPLNEGRCPMKVIENPMLFGSNK